MTAADHPGEIAPARPARSTGRASAPGRAPTVPSSSTPATARSRSGRTSTSPPPTRPGVRPRRRASACAWRSPRAPACASSPGSRRGRRSWRSAEPGVVPGIRLDVDDPAGARRGSPGSGWTITREAYADLYGPTVGDRVRLADTDLRIRVEEDRCRGPARRRRGRVRRRQGHPRVDGPGARHPGRGRAGPGDHRRAGPRPLGRGQGRRRRPRRPDRRHRQGRQPRHDGRRSTPALVIGPVDGDPRRATA